MSEKWEMVEHERLPVGLHDRLTQACHLNGTEDHAVPLLEAETTTPLINSILPDGRTRVPTTSLPSLPHLRVHSSVTLHCDWPKGLVVSPIKSVLTLCEFLSSVFGIRQRHVSDTANFALPLLSREAIALHSYRPVFLLSVGESHQCTAATAVHRTTSPSESLRTVCTTVKNFTKDTLRAVQTTADLYLPTAARSGILSLGKARKNLLLAIHSISWPWTPPATAILRGLSASVQSTPPLPPITTPPDEDPLEFKKCSPARLRSPLRHQRLAVGSLFSITISRAPPLPPITTPPDSDTASSQHRGMTWRNHDSKRVGPKRIFSYRAAAGLGYRLTEPQFCIGLLCSTAWSFH